jgi:hypothetical protein
MGRKKHPKPEVEDALRYAEQHGWQVKVAGPMPGAGYIALTTIKTAGAASSA